MVSQKQLMAFLDAYRKLPNRSADYLPGSRKIMLNGAERAIPAIRACEHIAAVLAEKNPLELERIRNL